MLIVLCDLTDRIVPFSLNWRVLHLGILLAQIPSSRLNRLTSNKPTQSNYNSETTLVLLAYQPK